MKQTLLFSGALICSGAACAATATPTMNFLSVPAVVTQGTTPHDVLRMRARDITTVIVKDRTECGLRPTAPSFDLTNAGLHLKYRLPITGAASSGPACYATAVFTLRNLPDRDLKVVADAEPTPALLVSAPTLDRVSMNFMASPAVPGRGTGQREMFQYVHKDSLTVVLRDPADCGSRAAEASYELRKDALRLKYHLPGAGGASAGEACVATAIFTLKHLPARQLQVVADADRTPMTVAQLNAAGSATSVERAASMSFVSVPAVEMPGARPEVLKSRFQDHMVVIVRDRGECGQRPARPSFDLNGGHLQVRYSLPEGDAKADARSCLATAIFTFRHLPERDVQVATQADRKPVQIASAAAY